MASMTSSPLRKRKKKHEKRAAQTQRFPQNAQYSIAQEQIGNRNQSDNSALRALRLSAREHCRMHFNPTARGTEGNLPPKSFAR
jgi:hypothetical protein